MKSLLSYLFLYDGYLKLKQKIILPRMKFDIYCLSYERRRRAVAGWNKSSSVKNEQTLPSE